jgi:serine/threonine protein kinase/tetratricopeptide (TPR) repeat protein
MDESAIFLEAIEQGTPEERAAFLDRACAGDGELRHNVEMLLKANARAGAFLDQPAANPLATADESAVAEAPGTVIGPYKLMEQIGEGGMGLVFVAEQQQPVRRKVALKVIKPGMDTRQVIARFEAERQALALMDHPHIAKVLDGGATGSGRPYFVMELVKGVPITEYCDQNQLPVRERLELFLSVCQAVQHAHQKGIIHRDLKPSNVLIMSQDGSPLAKVIDFGVAKAIGQQLTDKTIYTQFTQLVGTPLYMSPEQAGQSSVDVDTRSDIYSLGVLLYELLTGTTPFDKERFQEVDYDEMRRIIREEEPPRPSTRISTLGQAAPTISTQRKTDPKRLSQLLSGELDWIVMKCLEKDRNRRYETVNGLARDIERYLANEPVQACPPSTWYRLRKFVARNRAAVLAAGIVSATLVVGIIGTTGGLIQAMRAEKKAKDESDDKEEALRRLGAEQGRTAAALTEARTAEQEALEALRSLTSEFVERELASKVQLTPQDQKFLREVIDRYGRLASSKGDTPEARVTRAEGLGQVGLLRKKLGEMSEALRAYDQALPLVDALIAEFPNNAHYRYHAGAIRLGRATALKMVDRRAEAEADFRQAIDFFRGLRAEFPAEPRYASQLAICHNNLGNLLGEAQQSRNEGVAQLEAAAKIWSELVEAYPEAGEYRFELGRTSNNLGVRLGELERHEQAVAAYQRAIDVHRRMVNAYPRQADFRKELAVSLGNLAVKPQVTLEQAERLLREALDLQRQLAAEFPVVPTYQHELARTRANLALILKKQGNREAAAQESGQALTLRRQLVEQHPNVSEFRFELAVLLFNLGSDEKANGQADKSLKWYEETVATLRPLMSGEPRQHARGLYCLANRRHAELLTTFGRFAEAVADWDQVIKYFPGGNDVLDRVPRAMCLTHIDPALAVAEADELCRLARPAPGRAFDGKLMYSAACLCSQASHRTGDPMLREAYAARAVAMLREAGDLGFYGGAGQVSSLERDSYLAPIRSRDDFQKLLAELKKR